MIAKNSPAQWLQPLVVIRTRLPEQTVLIAALLILNGGQGVNAQNRPRGDAIGGGPIIGTNSATAGAAQTGTNAASWEHPNAAGEYVINFDVLTSFPMDLPNNLMSNTNQAAWADAQVNALIPPLIKALDGKKVRIEGFMLPTTWDKAGQVCDFLLLGNQMACCFGGPTQIHDFITIHVKGKPVESNMDWPIPVAGILHVGAVRENGQLVGIYRLETQGLVVERAH